ncbi:MAG: bifunctional DNA primase/polymerase [Planctomycetota bacterium]|nr:bifunctional DNA primase/polymerase [Planctomycetota bacterium]
MKNIMVCVVTAAWLVRAASAQDISRLDLECSLDGVTWSHDVAVDGSVADGTDVLLRARISWGGTTPAYGFGSLTFQPVIGNARPGIDVVNPFVDRGNNTTGGGVDLDDSPLDGPFGRVKPFAAVGPSGTTFFTSHVHDAGSGGAPLGSYLRIARNDVTRWVPTVKTGRGFHVYFRWPGQRTVKFEDGELRGEAAYCVAPPSLHESGWVTISSCGWKP